jgi:3-oxocholest-4-en-26-oate---CoA ligase
VTIEWSLAQVNDVITDAAPDRDMLVWRDQRRTFAQVRERTRGLAGFLVSRNIGARHERDDLARWECGQSTVALGMNNRPEYIEAMLGAYRARAVPFNVNQNYTPGEIGSLLGMVDAEVVVYQRSLGPPLAEALSDRPAVLIDVDDGSGTDPLPGSVTFDAAIEVGAGTELPEPTGDDLYLVCTGGTTGRPKGVLWRQADIFVSGMGGSDLTTAETITTTVAQDMGSWFAAPPMMHAAAQWTAYAGLHLGATVVMHDDSHRFDAAEILRVAEAERVVMMSIVGDAYARPIVEELRRGSYDLSALRRIGTGGAPTSDDNKQALVDLLPQVTVIDGYGASETGGMAFGVSNQSAKSVSFAPAGGATVLSADRTRFLEPGEDEIGWTARRGRVPLGYLDDQAATEATFPIVDGERVAVPGDRAQLEADGTIRMLGRDSLVVNTGGEKVFVEEVEQVLLRHPDVVDVLVVGRPSERFGQEVVAVVQRVPASAATGEELREFCAVSVARFKAPRAFVFTDTIARHASGKPDYQWARRQAEQPG